MFGYAFIDCATNELVTLESAHLGSDQQEQLLPATREEIAGGLKGVLQQR
jgi:hypothetical protein